MNGPRPRYNFPSWNYGYTLGPPSQAGNGDYSTYNSFPLAYGGGFRPQFARGGRAPFRGGFRGHPGKGPTPGVKEEDTSQDGHNAGVPESATVSSSGDTVAAAPGNADVVVKKEADETEAGAGPSGAAGPSKPESGEIVERPLSEILRGRNPIMFCNDQSKQRSLHMEWEQVSETGPAHDKTFTWSLKMGDDLMTLGSANSKKTAKNRAAEEMVKKLDVLPRPQKRNYFHMNHHMGPMNNFYRMPMPPPWMQQQMMKRRRMENPFLAPPQGVEAPAEGTSTVPKKEPPKLLHSSQNNPISKLYEYCKRKKLTEPIFETIAENVLETRRTQQGFTLKKTEFTMQCCVEGKQFIGNAMNKKDAKFNAATAAWAEIGAGVNQASISSLLQSHRNTSN